ncbi:GGDEF domain-containing protein [Kineosporia succinea]|uniref:Diguanylate cyclase (GGDEF)-like protein n=1 Tax=Kineosporia succinea TaxID=84632 RepID=A0ABT9NZ91_9ACTN|nr:GGDEF domain-containing protein [Kineosporia succinea]MDP9825753.1 diguanylate cyclase (GGDEF)-like protein [Kineosporia succinea]
MTGSTSGPAPAARAGREALARLRSRLAVVLAVVTLVPLLAGALLLGLIAPAHARSSAVTAATRDADAAAVALAASCDTVRSSTRVAAGEIAAYATRNGGVLDRPAAETLAARAVARRPGSAVAVYGPDSEVLATSGPAAGRAVAASIGSEFSSVSPSCSAGRAGATGDAAGLTEISPVLINPAGTTAKVGVATVVTWLPLDQAALGVLRTKLSTTGQLSVLPARGQTVVLATSGDREALAGLLRTLPSAGQQSGTHGGLGYRLTDTGTGLPYRVLATDPIGGTGLRVAGWALLAGALALLIPLWIVLMRLTRPVTQELSAAGDQLRAGRMALADSLDRFGEALAHTHDLNELLATVSGTALSGTDAAAALVLLVTDERDLTAGTGGTAQAAGTGGAGDRRAADRSAGGTGDRLSVRSETGRADAAGDEARGLLPAFAEQHFAELIENSQTSQVFAEPELFHLPGAGPVAVIGIGVDVLPADSTAERGPARRRLIGVLVVARGEGAAAFDALHLTRLRALAGQTGTAITNIRRYQEVRRLSMTDTLTGLGNRAQLVGALSREIAAASRGDGVLTVLMLDIDHFKSVNDTWGHGFGDIVLRDFAGRLLACVREADTVARYGGEEFVVLLRDTDAEGGCRVAERVLNAARSRPFEDADVSQPVTVSIGVAAYPRDGRSADDVLQAADSALYAAKRDGRNRWRVAEPLHNAPIPSLPG